MGHLSQYGFHEILGFYSLADRTLAGHFGCGLIWMGNEAVKQKTAETAGQTAEFSPLGFLRRAWGGPVRRRHGPTPMGDGQYRSSWGKYYIGTATKSALVSTFAKNSETDEYVFFAVDSNMKITNASLN